MHLTVQMAEAYHFQRPDLHLSVSGGGSGLGIIALLNGHTDIANSSRPINAEELVLFKKAGIRLDSFLIAGDAIAIIVSEAIAIDSLDVETLASIFSGKIKDWSELGLNRRPISLYGRQRNSGTYEFLKQKLAINFSPKAKEMSGSAQILESVRQDKGGIGYVGAGYVQKANIKGIKILYIRSRLFPEAVSPLDSKIIEKQLYFFQRPLYQYFLANQSKEVRAFLDFEHSATGQKIIQETGYFLLKQNTHP